MSYIEYYKEKDTDPILFLQRFRCTTEPIGGGTEQDEEGELVSWDAAVAAIEIAKKQLGWRPASELHSLMDKEDQYGCSLSVLFSVKLDGINYINKGSFDYDTGVWHSIDTGLSYTKEQVTHWMPLPAPPREEE